MLITPDPATLGAASAPRVIALALFVALLIAKEMTIATPEHRAQTIGRILDVGLIPLLVVCGAIIVAEVAL